MGRFARWVSRYFKGEKIILCVQRLKSQAVFVVVVVICLFVAVFVLFCPFFFLVCVCVWGGGGIFSCNAQLLTDMHILLHLLNSKITATSQIKQYSLHRPLQIIHLTPAMIETPQSLDTSTSQHHSRGAR